MLTWKKYGKSDWQLLTPEGEILGDVGGPIQVEAEQKGMYFWDAPTLVKTRAKPLDITGNPVDVITGLRGYATTLDGAKRIVQTIIIETGTAARGGCTEKDKQNG